MFTNRIESRERIGFAELSAKWRIGSLLLAAESAALKIYLRGSKSFNCAGEMLFLSQIGIHESL
jgi:hypothetical protein